MGNDMNKVEAGKNYVITVGRHLVQAAESC